jgi:hypothetical protein
MRAVEAPVRIALLALLCGCASAPAPAAIEVPAVAVEPRPEPVRCAENEALKDGACVAVERVPEWKPPRGGGDPCQAWNTPKNGLVDCDPRMEGDSDMRFAIFNFAAAASRLAGVAVSDCGRAGGPTGPGKISVTFESSGKAKEAVITAPYAGTTVGACIVSRYRAVTVPAFTGAPVTVTEPVQISP